MSHTIYNAKWNKDDGNNKLILNYPLTEDSWILELGGFEGWFTQKAVSETKSNIIVLEPINQFCEKIQTKFQDNPKVHVECKGISDKRGSTIIYVNGDSSSQHIQVSGIKNEIELYPLEYFLEKYNINKIDLAQLNIEGEEYNLLDHWISTGQINLIKYLQIQYHIIDETSRDRKSKIEDGLQANGFINKWDYDMVFTSWENTKI
jgi:FkbM family methyltransferase